MGIQTRDYFLEKFIAGYKITEQDYADWLNSYLHVNDSVSGVEIDLANYYDKTEVDSLLTSKQVTGDYLTSTDISDLATKSELNNYSLTGHNHQISDVDGLDAALQSISVTGVVKSINQIYTPDASGNVDIVLGGQEISSINGLQDALDSKQVTGDYLTSESASGFATTQHYHNVGIVDADPTITPNGLNITASAVVVSLYNNNTFTGHPSHYHIPEASFTCTDNTTNYLYVDYNNGNPIYKLTLDVADINESSTTPINTILASNGYLHLSHWDRLGDGLPNKLHRRFVKTQRYARESGLTLSVSGGVVSIADGIVWRGARAFELKDCHSNGISNNGVSGTQWFIYNTVNGTWTPHYMPTPAYNYTQYDNRTNLVSLTTLGNKDYFNINWVYRGVEDHQHGYIVLSDKEYKDLPTAIAETKIPTIPTEISTHAILVGRIICQKNVVTPAWVEGSFDSVFQGTVINDHNELSGIQGGLVNTEPEYYHLTADEYNSLQSVPADIGEVTGVVVQTPDAITPTWNGKILTFVGTEIIYYRNRRFLKTDTTIDTTSLGNGKHYLFYAPSGSDIYMTSSTSGFPVENYSVHYKMLYRSGSVDKLGEERHKPKMDADTHARLHFCEGATIENGGFEVSATNTSITISAGAFWDEDIRIYIPQQTTVGMSHWKDTYYERTGAQSNYFSFNSLSTVPQYNNSSNIPTDISSGYFGLYWILATHQDTTPILSLLHNEQYSTIRDASAGYFHTDIRHVIASNSYGATQELIPVACVILQNLGGSASFVEKYDMRYTSTKIKQDVNSTSEVHFQDVYLHDLTGNTLGQSSSLKTMLSNIDIALSESIYYATGYTATGWNILAGSIADTVVREGTIAGSMQFQETLANGTVIYNIPASGAFNRAEVSFRYDGGNPHSVSCYLVGVSVADLLISTITNPNYNTFVDTIKDISDYTNYVSNGIAQIKFVHSNNVNTNHLLYVDKIALIKTSSASTPPNASESTSGLIQIASAAEVADGSNVDKAVPPDYLAANYAKTSVLSNYSVTGHNHNSEYLSLSATGTFVTDSELTQTLSGYIANGGTINKITSSPLSAAPENPILDDIWIVEDDNAFAVNPFLKNYTEVTHIATVSASAYNVDIYNGNVQNLTISTNTTITLPACPEVSGYSWALTLRLIISGTVTSIAFLPNAGNLHWFTGDNLIPTFNYTNGAVNVVTFESYGTNAVIGHWGGSKAI